MVSEKKNVDELQAIVEGHGRIIETLMVEMKGFEAALGCMVDMRAMRDTMREVWKDLDNLSVRTGNANEDYKVRTGIIQMRNKLKKTLEETGNW